MSEHDIDRPTDMGHAPGQREVTGERAARNAFYLTGAGQQELRAMLRSGCYHVNEPEEGALLVVAWLLEHGHADQASAVLDQIEPQLSWLRFYPVPAPVSLVPSAVVHVQRVRETLEDIEATYDNPAFATMRETIQVWHPLCDEIVQLFLETVDGPLPRLRTGAGGKPLCDAHGRFQVEGGWPCQHYPEGWRVRG